MVNKTLSQVMTTDPISLTHDQTVTDAAARMARSDVGSVLVQRDGDLLGIVTDRDLVVRCLADGKDPGQVKLDTLCTDEVVTMEPSSSLKDAVDTMREKKVRRVPVVENGHPVGIVSLGDLAVLLDRESALGEISAAPSNNE
jgi:CBS domain-containing protein